MKVVMKKILAVGFIWLLFVCILPIGKMEVQAEEERTITYTPTEYDITNKVMTINVSTNATDCYLAYYVEDERWTYFDNAVKTTETSVDVQVTDGDYIFIWYVDENGVPFDDKSSELVPYDDRLAVYIDTIFAQDKDNSIKLVNGNSFADYEADFRVEKGFALFNVPDVSEDMDIQMCLRCENEFWHLLGTSYWGYYDGKVDVREHIGTSGSYPVVMWLEGEGVRSRTFTFTYDYVQPEEQLPTVSDLKWSEYKVGKISFNTVGPTVDYICYLEQRRVDGQDDMPCLSYSAGSWVTDTYVLDFSEWMDEEGMLYRVGVRALSDNIEEIYNSEIVYTEYMNPADLAANLNVTLEGILTDLGVDSVEKADAESLTAIYNNAEDDKKVQIAEELKEGLTNLLPNELKVGMQTNSETRATVSAIEAMSGVTVSVNVAEDVSDIVDNSKVSIVGAGLNAEEGNTSVSLNITDAAEYVPTTGRYKNCIPLGISLSGVKNTDTELDIPVRVTMPIPDGIDWSKLVILHLTDDESVDEIFTSLSGYSINEEERTVSFTVTHFSTFVFAEESETESGDDTDTDHNTGTDSSTENGDNTESENNTGTTQVGDLTCIDGKYYFYENGVMVTSKEAYVNGAWRWFDADGTMAVDKDVYQTSSGGKWVRYNENGEMIKGEDYRYGGWYYFEPITGNMMKGPVVLEDGRKVFYDTINGKMLMGEHVINGETYLFDENDGHLINGTDTCFWVNADGKDYWYENWQRQGWNPANDAYRGKEIYDPATNAWYWLDNVQQGAKAVSKDVYQESYSAYPDREDGTGKWVRYDENGHMIKGWQTTDLGTYYFETITGAMAKGNVIVDGVEYYFDIFTGIQK